MTSSHGGDFAIKRLSLSAVIVGLVLGLLTNPLASQAPQAPAYEAMAAYWAPVIVHDFGPGISPHDYLTRFDYDGDWLAPHGCVLQAGGA